MRHGIVMLVDAQDLRGNGGYQAILPCNGFGEASVTLQRQFKKESKSYTATM